MASTRSLVETGQIGFKFLEIHGGVVLGLRTRFALQHTQQIIRIFQRCAPLVELDPIAADQCQVGPRPLDRFDVQRVGQVNRPGGLLDLHPVLAERIVLDDSLLAAGRNHARHRYHPLVGQEMKSGGQPSLVWKATGDDQPHREREISFAGIGQSDQNDVGRSRLLRINRPGQLAVDRNRQHLGFLGNPNSQELLSPVANLVNSLGPPTAVGRQNGHQFCQLHSGRRLSHRLGSLVFPPRHVGPWQHPPHPGRLVKQRRFNPNRQSSQVVLLDLLDPLFIFQCQRAGRLVDKECVPLLCLHLVETHGRHTLVIGPGHRLFENDLRRSHGD